MTKQSFYKQKLLSRSAMIFLLSGAIGFNANAQRDTTKKQSIDITSSYKPVLRNAVKINFSGSQLAADTSRPVLAYTIPAQNLFYAYQPISLKPLALEADTNLYLGGRHYIKAGFGSYSTPYVKAGLSFGDGRTSLFNLTGKYIGSKGDIKNQDYSQMNVTAAGSYFGKKNEVYAGASYSQDNYYLYGYDHAVYDFKRDEIRQQFQDITITGGAKNSVKTGTGISYNPNLELNFFTNKNKISETTIKVNLPVEKIINENITAQLEAKGDFSHYSTTGIIANNTKFSNNLISVSPAILYHAPRVYFTGGISPTWNNGKWEFLPNVHAEAQLQENVFMLQAGWVGRFTKNTYRNLTTANPYLLRADTQLNTKEIEYYGGLKATLGKHFNVNAKAGWVSFDQFPIFINDTATDSKGFLVKHEPTMNSLRVHGDISYINQDKFTLNAGITFNGYTGMNVNRKAWNTLPMEATASLRWFAFKHLLIKSDLWLFGGGNAITKGNSSRGFSGGTDLSAGAEYKINKQFSAWLDVNNILNDKYERWHNYQVYGLNLVGGILIHF
ncbi:MAG: hypothetical protein JWQ27_3282 [Ferruginibacter sp.]|nr:hypothetical protein [Ferruginibacter sp.]